MKVLKDQVKKPHKVSEALKECKSLHSTFKSEERRRVSDMC